MRFLASLDGNLFYVQDNQGTVYQLPGDGTPGVPVPHPEHEAASLSNHASWLRRAGREQCADRWQTASEALLACQPTRTAAA